jgi:hypothetical protein
MLSWKVDSSHSIINEEQRLIDDDELCFICEIENQGGRIQVRRKLAL